MRKIIVISMVTLDGVIQAPGGPEEDTSGDFKYGGWIIPYNDEFFGKVIGEELSKPFDLLLGRKTYEIWAPYWPNHNQGMIGAAFDKVTKYVASHGALELTWKGSVLLQGNVVEAVKKLKSQDGPELQVHGSGNLIQTLLKYDLIDELRLRIVPITLGSGKRLFAEGALPAAFTLEQSKASPKGVIYASYKRAGEVETGSF